MEPPLAQGSPKAWLPETGSWAAGGARTGSPASFTSSHFRLLVFAPWGGFLLRPGQDRVHLFVHWQCFCQQTFLEDPPGTRREKTSSLAAGSCRVEEDRAGGHKCCTEMSWDETSRRPQPGVGLRGKAKGERRKLGRLSGGGGAGAALKNKCSKRTLLRGGRYSLVGKS